MKTLTSKIDRLLRAVSALPALHGLGSRDPVAGRRAKAALISYNQAVDAQGRGAMGRDPFAEAQAAYDREPARTDDHDDLKGRANHHS